MKPFVRGKNKQHLHMKLISWNVNGLRAVLRKNFLEFIEAEKPDVLCLQETKCASEDIEALWTMRFSSHWNCAEKKGYSGTAIFALTPPLSVTSGIGMAEHDREGQPEVGCRPIGSLSSD